MHETSRSLTVPRCIVQALVLITLGAHHALSLYAQEEQQPDPGQDRQRSLDELSLEDRVDHHRDPADSGREADRR